MNVCPSSFLSLSLILRLSLSLASSLSLILSLSWSLYLYLSLSLSLSPKFYPSNQLNYKADGSPFWNQFFVAALRDSEGGVVNYVGVQCEVNTLPIEGIKDR